MIQIPNCPELLKRADLSYAVPKLQPGGALGLVTHLVSYKGVANVQTKKKKLHLQPGAAEIRSLTPDGYSSHAQQYRCFIRPAAARTGLLWKIPLNWALGLTTPHFA